MDILNFTDEDLKLLMEKYKEKQIRYDLLFNEATERNQKIIDRIHQEQLRRWREIHLEAFRKSKMDTTSD
jgi:hypothetical protein